MIATNKTQLTKDLPNKKLIVTREFNAPVKDVWNAWTQKELLDKWWAPKPWKTETKSMDFRVGGLWLYAMVGPDGTKIWCLVDYTKIDSQKCFEGNDAFCDENGKKTNEFPGSSWKVEFQPSATGTKVHVEISYTRVEDLNKIIEMGFEAGFTMAHGNLDELLER